MTTYTKTIDIEIQVSQVKPLLKVPAMYQVVMHNDDFTPMEFVVSILELFFNMDRLKATAVMYDVHLAGKAVCGVYTKDVAETKANQVMEYARMHEHPLLCSTEAT